MHKNRLCVQMCAFNRLCLWEVGSDTETDAFACSPALCCCGKHQLRCCHLLGDKGRGIGNAMLPRPGMQCYGALSSCASLARAPAVLPCAAVCCASLCCWAVRCCNCSCARATHGHRRQPCEGGTAQCARQVGGGRGTVSAQQKCGRCPCEDQRAGKCKPLNKVDGVQVQRGQPSCKGEQRWPAEWSGVTGACWLSCVDGVCMHGLTRKFRV